MLVPENSCQGFELNCTTCLKILDQLPGEAGGVFMLLLMHLWEEGGSGAFDPVALAKVTRCTPRQWSAAWRHLQPLFQVEGGRVTLSPTIETDLIRPLSLDRIDAHG